MWPAADSSEAAAGARRADGVAQVRVRRLEHQYRGSNPIQSRPASATARPPKFSTRHNLLKLSAKWLYIGQDKQFVTSLLTAYAYIQDALRITQKENQKPSKYLKQNSKYF